MKRIFILGFIFCMPFMAAEKRSYFDTKFLAQSELVKQQLIEVDGFTEGFFPASDGLRLNFVWLSRPQARCTLICSSGFWPGAKEGMATLYELLAKDCNILLFDARGHGTSDGSLWRNVLQYGEREYNDIIGAVQWAHEQSKKPIVLFGVCAGAFHATHALLNMQKQQLLEQYDIRGLVFDSGWDSLTSIVPTALSGEWRKRMMKSIRTAPQIVQNGVRLAIVSPVSFLLQLATPPLVWALVSKPARQAALLPRIKALKTPVLYIHSEDDSFAPISPVKQLAQNTCNAHTWWITEPSTHACHHIKHANAYRDKLQQFIEAVVST